MLSAGRIYCDLNFSGMDQLPQLGREVFARELSLHAGGGAFITAAYMTALGMPSSLMGRLPAPPFADIVRQEAEQLGLDLQHCAVDEGASPQLTVAMSMAGDRAFLTNRQGDALPDDHVQRMQQLDKTNALTHLHISELSSLLEYPHLVTEARRAGFTVSLDCAWDDACLDHPEIASLVSQVDVFLPNESEMQRLLDNGVGLGCAALTVVKQGAAGATAHMDGVQIQVPAVPSEVVDTIGAGDAFNAGFLSAWLSELPLRRCLVAGNACGALAVGRRGGAGKLPDLRYILDDV